MNELVKARIQNDAKRIITESIKNAYTFSRSSLFSNDEMGNHDVDAECGYPLTLKPDILWKWFRREDMGYRMTIVKPETCWATKPIVRENDDVEETTFEKQIKEIEEKMHLWNYAKRADVVSGIGSFGVMMIGINDGKKFAEPVEGVDAGTEGIGRATKKHEVKYFRIFAQHQVSITRLVNDPANPRFGLPEMYSLTFDSNQNNVAGGIELQQPMEANPATQEEVHWTRVVHLADNRDTSDLYGTSRLQRIYNRLIDYRKVVGGSAEMYWKGAFPGLSIESQPDFADAEFDKEATKEAIEAYQDGLKRYLALQGMTIKSLEPQISDPTAQYKMLVMAMAMAEGIPYRILLGVEEGKQAGSQDVVQWNTKMESRREDYLNPLLIRPILDRLIAMNVLDDVSYKIVWNPLNEQTLEEQISNALNRTKALAEYLRGGVNNLIAPEDYYKIFLKLEASEIAAIVKNMDQMLDDDLEDEENDVAFDPNANPSGQQNKLDENKV